MPRSLAQPLAELSKQAHVRLPTPTTRTTSEFSPRQKHGDTRTFPSILPSRLCFLLQLIKAATATKLSKTETDTICNRKKPWAGPDSKWRELPICWLPFRVYCLSAPKPPPTPHPPTHRFQRKKSVKIWTLCTPEFVEMLELWLPSMAVGEGQQWKVINSRDLPAKAASIFPGRLNINKHNHVQMSLNEMWQFYWT